MHFFCTKCKIKTHGAAGLAESGDGATPALASSADRPSSTPSSGADGVVSNLWSATTSSGIELMHRIRKRQFDFSDLGVNDTATTGVWNVVLFNR
ncbi:hypothetical protein R69776_01607 [Paraburkholderia nemoris]|uniref:Uncharacterized protein n=1 Tax=Paraburkholderia nemoris TaxID=2793076 RepID=A0ABM8QY87_9BURK|nr:hypothetical protein R69776_01607 [Paraburkholderia nemoris]CAE6750377.1 hypothetical protein R75777_02962 [Paraburkholderia nemoris]